MATPKWEFKSIQGVEKAINNLYDRTISNRDDIDLLIAQIHLLQTPRWRFLERRITKRWIKTLSKEKEENEIES